MTDVRKTITLDAPPTRAQVLQLFKMYTKAAENYGPSHLSPLPAVALRDLCGLALDLMNQNDELSDRLDLLKIDHEVTKGYRQHAEQQLAALRAALPPCPGCGVGMEWDGAEVVCSCPSGCPGPSIDDAREHVMAFARGGCIECMQPLPHHKMDCSRRPELTIAQHDDDADKAGGGNDDQN